MRLDIACKYLAIMLLNNILNNGKTQAATLLFGGDVGFKYMVNNFFRKSSLGSFSSWLLSLAPSPSFLAPPESHLPPSFSSSFSPGPFSS